MNKLLLSVALFISVFAFDVSAQRFTEYKDSTLCVKGFSSVIRSADGSEFYAYAQRDLFAQLTIRRFQRTGDTLVCTQIASAGEVLPTNGGMHAQSLIRGDTMFIGSRQIAYRSASWGVWEEEVIESGNREMEVTSLNPLPDGRILAAAHSYIVVRRDTSGGNEITWIDSATSHIGYLDGLSFVELNSGSVLGVRAMHDPGATMPDGTTYLGTYRGSVAQPLMYEITSEGSVNAIPPPAGLPRGLQSPVIVRVGEHIVYTFYGANFAEGASDPACYVRYDRRTKTSTRHIIDSPFPHGGWSGDSLALVMCDGTVHVVRENTVLSYRVMDQISFPWVPSFSSAHRTSSTEWLISCNSGIFFFEFDATTSVDEDPTSHHQDRIATISRVVDLTKHATLETFDSWTVFDALGRTCAEGYGSSVALPQPAGLYIVKFGKGLITVLAM
ncbi:MAG: hypothetical protein H7X70_01675 [Candidatus Kapabacteria bacterium]|nr:hypothetical protein [Candidatus Kapabacteria bacterium]